MRNDYRSGKILVVEVQPSEREGMAELLRGWGYDVETASDGVKALEKISSFGPVLILADQRMPGMGGIELLKALQGELRTVRNLKEIT